MTEFNWKGYSVGCTVTRPEMALGRMVPISEPWWRRALIRVGLARQRYRPPTMDEALAQIDHDVIRRQNALMQRLEENLLAGLDIGKAARKAKPWWMRRGS